MTRRKSNRSDKSVGDNEQVQDKSYGDKSDGANVKTEAELDDDKSHGVNEKAQVDVNVDKSVGDNLDGDNEDTELYVKSAVASIWIDIPRKI